MKRILIAAAAVTMMCGSAFAQTGTGPAPQSDNMNKPGMSDGMKKGSTTGMNSGTNTTSGMTANPQRDAPNGAPGSMPKATTGPSGGAASETENGKH
jgi:hypothetical protein